MNGLVKSLNSVIEKRYALCFAAVALVVCFNLFYRLGALPVQNLDEARQGMSAYEMTVSGDYIKNTYQFGTDYYNTKPPLLFWMIALSFKIFGFSVFAMRFPSALLGLASIILVMFLARRYSGKAASLFSGLILSATYAFVHFHSARKGDFDSLLVFLLTLSMFFLFSSDKKKWFYVLSGFATGLAFLAKSFAVIQIFGIVAVYLFFTGRYKKFTVGDHLKYLAAFAVPVLVWAVFRFQSDGLLYFQSMLGNDIVTRTTHAYGTIPNLPIWYFGVVLMHFFPWSLLLVISLFYRNSVSTARDRDGRTKISFGLNEYFRQPLFAVWAVVPFVLFSMNSTRLDWYIVGIYPPLSILVGWFITDVMSRSPSKHFLRGVRILAVFAVCMLVYETASVIVINDQDRRSDQRLLLEMRSNGQNKASIFFVNRGENYGEMFLAEALHGYRIRAVGDNSYFVSEGTTNDILYLQDNLENVRFADTNRLNILERNSGYMIAGKPAD